MHWFSFVILLLTYLLISPAYSEETKRIFQLDEIVVSEDALKEELITPNAVVVIPELLLQGMSSTLDGALLRQTGVDVQRLQEIGGALDDDSIRVRGFGSRRLVVATDGRLLNTPGTAGGYFVDWTAIGLANIERIQIIKGVSDPRYGNTLGGVINLVTKKPTERPLFELQAMYGRYDTEKFTFFHSYKPSQFEYSLSGNYLNSSGYLRNGSQTLKNLTLYTGYSLSWNAKLKANLQYSETKKGFLVNNRLSKNPDSPLYNIPLNPSYPASDGEIMYGGMGAYPEDGSWWKRQRVNLDFGYEQSVFGGVLDLRLWKNYAEREAYNTRKSANRVFHKKWFDDRSYGFDGSYRLITKGHDITFGLQYAVLRDGGDKNYPDDFRSPFYNANYVNSKTLGIYLMDDYFLTDKLILTPGMRYSSYKAKAGPSGQKEGIKDLSMSGLSPSLKLTYNYQKQGFLYVSLARALRMPTLPEHYWHYSPDAGVYTADLPFKKEDGLMIQGGWKAELPSKTAIVLSPYYYRIRDFIYFDLINFVSYNIDKASLYGVELEIAQQLGMGLSAFANYTYQLSKTEGDPLVENFVAPSDRSFNELPMLPRHKINFGLKYKSKDGGQIALYGRYNSSQKVLYNNNTLYNTELRLRRQPSYFTADLEINYPITKGLSMLAYLHNLFDRHYQERFGYPSAGRNWGVALRGVF